MYQELSQQLSQQLDSCLTCDTALSGASSSVLSQVLYDVVQTQHSSTKALCSLPPRKKKRLFAQVKSDEEVKDSKATGIPPKISQDSKQLLPWTTMTSYIEVENNGSTEDLSREELKHWLSRFILGVTFSTRIFLTYIVYDYFIYVRKR